MTPRPEYPRPQFVREEHWINLNGLWEFEMDPAQSGRARQMAISKRLSGSIIVPFAPESVLSGIGFRDFMPAVWYRRDLSIPVEWMDRRVHLHIGASDYETWVYLDGKQVGHHQGGYTPFIVDLTGALGGNHCGSLTIYIEDNVRNGVQAKGKQSHLFASSGWDYTRTTGIWQTVWLESVPLSYISQLKITPQLASETVFIGVQIQGDIRASRLCARVKVGETIVSQQEIECPPGGGQLALPVPQARLWSPSDPFLYDLEVQLSSPDQRHVDMIKSYFGMRSVAIVGCAIELNGQPLFQRLILDQGFYPDGIYTAPTDEALRSDIELSLAMGFNGARLHQKVFEPRFLYWCDRLGYLVWGETPDWGLDVSRADALSVFLNNWVEQIERDYSHPAIVGWIPFNEHDARNNPQSFRAIYHLTKALDPTRPCIDSSGWTHVQTDIFDVHDYVQDPVVFRARYDALVSGQGEIYRNLDIVPHNTNFTDYQPDHPYFVSEFGGIWWNPGQAASDPAWGYGAFPKSVEEFQYRFQGLVEVLLGNPKMCGFCYTQLTDVEQEVNGLYFYDRRAKFDVGWIRAVVSQPAAIETARALPE